MPGHGYRPRGNFNFNRSEHRQKHRHKVQVEVEVGEGLCVTGGVHTCCIHSVQLEHGWEKRKASSEMARIGKVFFPAVVSFCQSIAAEVASSSAAEEAYRPQHMANPGSRMQE